MSDTAETDFPQQEAATGDNYTKYEPSDDGVPPQVAKYLMRGELPIIATRYHWAVMIWEAAILLGSLLAAILLNIWCYYRVPGGATPTEIHLIWGQFAVVSLWYAFKAAVYRRSWLVITPARIMTISGILRRQVIPLPMRRVNDMELIQTLPGRLLGYGTLHTQSFATGHALETIDYVPSPEAINRSIWETRIRWEERQAAADGTPEG